MPASTLKARGHSGRLDTAAGSTLRQARPTFKSTERMVLMSRSASSSHSVSCERHNEMAQNTVIYFRSGHDTHKILSVYLRLPLFYH